MLEDELQARIRLSLGKRTDCVLFRNSVGLGTNQSGGRVRYGLSKGSSDLIGFIRGSGRFIALEVKTEVGRESEDQKRFRALVNLGGGFARVVRSEEEANAAVDEAIRTAQ